METNAEFRAYLQGYADAKHSISEEEMYAAAVKAAYKCEHLMDSSYRRTSAEIETAVNRVMQGRR